MKVELKNGQRISISQLQLGQEVKTLDHNDAVKFSEVMAFLHKLPTGFNKFLRFDLERGVTLTLTAEHLVYVTSKNSLTRQAIFARDVKIGDQLVTFNGIVASITKITTVMEEGLYAPLTDEGNLVANGVLVSCYAHVQSHTLGHLTMAPVRILRRVIKGLSNISPVLGNILSENVWNTAIDFYTNMLLSFTSCLPFKDSILSINSPGV